MKRLLDAAAALTGLLVTSPLMAAAMLAIRWETPGPALFAQTRVGRGGRPFTCYKLRTMRIGTGNLPTHDAPPSAVTQVGAFLRKSKLDELPQLYNVLVGEMSLVGPRPCLPGQTELVAERERAGVFAVRPGITGLAQVQGIDMSQPARLASVDADYVRTASLTGDLRLLLATVLGGGMGIDRIRE